jgi:Tfp pilus assembly pilus retraction ATPase PilT
MKTSDMHLRAGDNMSMRDQGTIEIHGYICHLLK